MGSPAGQVCTRGSGSGSGTWGPASLGVNLFKGMSRRIDDLVRLAGQQVDWALIVEPAAGRGEPQRNLPTVQTVWLECLEHAGDCRPWAAICAELEVWIQFGAQVVDGEDSAGG